MFKFCIYIYISFNLRAKNVTKVLKIDGFKISGSYGMKDAQETVTKFERFKEPNPCEAHSMGEFISQNKSHKISAWQPENVGIFLIFQD